MKALPIILLVMLGASAWASADDVLAQKYSDLLGFRPGFSEANRAEAESLMAEIEPLAVECTKQLASEGYVIVEGDVLQKRLRTAICERTFKTKGPILESVLDTCFRVRSQASAPKTPPQDDISTQYKKLIGFMPPITSLDQIEMAKSFLEKVIKSSHERQATARQYGITLTDSEVQSLVRWRIYMGVPLHTANSFERAVLEGLKQHHQRDMQTDSALQHTITQKMMNVAGEYIAQSAVAAREREEAAARQRAAEEAYAAQVAALEAQAAREAWDRERYLRALEGIARGLHGGVWIGP